MIEEGSNVEIGVKGKKTIFNVDEVDWKTGERTLGEKAKKKVRDRINEDLQISVLASGSSWINVPTGSIFWTITKKDVLIIGGAETKNKRDNIYEAVVEDLEVVSAEGQLIMRK